MNYIINSIFELYYHFFMKKQKPTLLALAVDRFTNSTWLEDLYHFKSFDQYLYEGKGTDQSTN